MVGTGATRAPPCARPWTIGPVVVYSFGRPVEADSTAGRIARLAGARRQRWGGREAEGGGLLNRCRGTNLYPGFESLPHRQLTPVSSTRYSPSLACSTYPRHLQRRVRADPAVESRPPAPPDSSAYSVESSRGLDVRPVPGWPVPEHPASPNASRTCVAAHARRCS